MVISKLKTQISKLPIQQAQGRQLKTQNFEKKFNAEIIEAEYDQEKILLTMPQTFMNHCGEAVAKIMQYYKIGTDDLVVVCDDLDLALGTIRIRLEGSSGGHKGLQSIIDHIGEKFARIRIGIGSNREMQNDKLTIRHSGEDQNLSKEGFRTSRNDKLINQPINQSGRAELTRGHGQIPAEDYVLQNFSKDEIEIINKSIDKAGEMLLEWIGGTEFKEETIRIEASI